MENRQETTPKSPNRLVQLLEARPLMFWGGTWASLVLVAGVSVSSLVSPGLIGTGQTASGAAIGSSGNIDSNGTVAQPVIQPSSQAKNSFPFWLFSAIALSCTAGSILVSKQLAPQRSRRIIRTQSPVQAKTRTAMQPKAVQPKAVQPTRSQPQSTASAHPTKAAGKSQGRKVAAKRQMASASAQSVRRRTVRPAVPQRVPARSAQVAIVPQTETHPLDWKTASIADSMDIRKQRSLASWL